MKQDHFCGTIQRVQGYWDLVSGENLINFVKICLVLS